MTKEEIAQKILEEFESDNDYILQLRVFNNYNEDALNRLLDLLEKYRISLGTDVLIDRQVSGWLYSTHGILLSMQVNYQNSQHPNKAKAGAALSKIDTAIMSLFFIGKDEPA